MSYQETEFDKGNEMASKVTQFLYCVQFKWQQDPPCDCCGTSRQARDSPLQYSTATIHKTPRCPSILSPVSRK
jgi:hypothetical protein